jgi:hypothetical protein
MGLYNVVDTSRTHARPMANGHARSNAAAGIFALHVLLQSLYVCRAGSQGDQQTSRPPGSSQQPGPASSQPAIIARGCGRAATPCPCFQRRGSNSCISSGVWGGVLRRLRPRVA